MRPECSLYTTLNESTRSAYYDGRDSQCDRMNVTNQSDNWRGTGWYRYKEPAGTRELF